jgi:hypothetical protein
LRQCDRLFEARIVPVRHSTCKQASRRERPVATMASTSHTNSLFSLREKDFRSDSLANTAPRHGASSSTMASSTTSKGSAARSGADVTTGIAETRWKWGSRRNDEELPHDLARCKGGQWWANEPFICFCPTADSTIGRKLNWYRTGGQVG